MLKFENALFESASGFAKQLPERALPEVAFAGRSNVGKSSLINKLINRKALARVSSTPGKTVTINFYLLNEARLVDLPGYGYAKVARDEKQRWSSLLDEYFGSGRPIRLVVQLIDMRHPPTGDDVSMLQYLQQTGYTFIIALTKSDKLNKTERANRLMLLKQELDFLGEFTAVPFSALKGEGVPELRNIISDAVGAGSQEILNGGYTE